MIFFLHIPKTAGTTFYGVVRTNHNSFLKPKIENSPLDFLISSIKNKDTAIRLPGGYESAPQTLQIIEKLPSETLNNITFIGGHVGFGLHEKLNINIEYITFIRDPRERLFSDYREHCKAGRYFYDKLKADNFNFNTYLAALKEERMDNILTRQLAGPYDYFLKQRTPVDDELLKLANKNSKLITFFDMDRFDRALTYMKKRFGWKKIEYQIKNQSIAQRIDFDIDENLLSEVIKYDLKLYSKIKPIEETSKSYLESLFGRK